MKLFLDTTKDRLNALKLEVQKPYVIRVASCANYFLHGRLDEQNMKWWKLNTPLAYIVPTVPQRTCELRKEKDQEFDIVLHPDNSQQVFEILEDKINIENTHFVEEVTRNSFKTLLQLETYKTFVDQIKYIDTNKEDNIIEKYRHFNLLD
jgi:hypothetical protein